MQMKTERFSMLKGTAAENTAWLLGEQQSHMKSVLRIGNIATSNLVLGWLHTAAPHLDQK